MIEASTGSGKTLIGMLCIQDWLRALQAGQSILVVVPTSNYLQQWSGELTSQSIGLGLSPDILFAGTPMQLYRYVIRTGDQPAIVLTTYTALAQFGSPTGKGGFDAASLEMFLQGANVKYVIPCLLIDATATRNVTAWQQLIGRAIRARRSWSNDCYRLLTLLTGHHLPLDGADAPRRPAAMAHWTATCGPCWRRSPRPICRMWRPTATCPT